MASLTLVSLADALVPQVMADALVALSRLTGQAWGPNVVEDLFWFQPPKVHIFEFVLVNLFVWWCFRASWGYRSRAWKYLRGVPPDMCRESRLNALLGFFFLLCWVFQVVLKAVRPRPFIQLGWMFMPCHLITLLWAVVLLRSGPRHYPMNTYLATLAADYHWGPAAAIASPDWGDHQYKLEGHVFMLHHGLLLLMPFYYAARYELLPMTTSHLLHVTAVATLVNIGFYTPYSLITGLNLNYMLYPPPKLMRVFPFTAVAYRLYIIAFLIALTATFHVVIAGFGMGVRRLMSLGKLKHQLLKRRPRMGR
ncbi:TMEM164 family protein [Trypanosoma rangeli]|uniref:TMEM164 family protein n=1 Tax=Trypanosoma rangeli TaxID=5698 RepID=A0A422NBZ1_TRYRA|nr:TMEM164 family protein [Trypanosoma rangeli]RNF03020.1 TMEM164 family protein [Trypanosoma rangeli]|eukprot:RNF03020.1 TMEM164 family protein [Trypanosoma rangeli]